MRACGGTALYLTILSSVRLHQSYCPLPDYTNVTLQCSTTPILLSSVPLHKSYFPSLFSGFTLVFIPHLVTGLNSSVKSEIISMQLSGWHISTVRTARVDSYAHFGHVVSISLNSHELNPVQLRRIALQNVQICLNETSDKTNSSKLKSNNYQSVLWQGY
jgi:hypothetical protein